MDEKKLPGWIKLNKDGSARFRLEVDVNGETPPAPPLTRGGMMELAANFDELKTLPEDWVLFKFRAISAAYLGESGYFLDFSRPGVLMNSIPLMLPEGKGGSRRTWLKFHRNHLEKIEARIGYIANAYWGDAGGKQSAPGINIDTAIDWKLAQDEVRKLTSEPPLLDSVSISFTGKFEKSHPDLGWEFWDLLGHEVDGEVVRIIVTEIYDYYHIGLVTEGADEEADLIVEDEQSLNKSAGGTPPGPPLKKGGETGNFENVGGIEMDIFSLTEEQVAAIAKGLGLQDMTPVALCDAVTAVVAERDGLKKDNSALKLRGEAFDKRLSDERTAVKSLIAKVEGADGKVLNAAVDLMQFTELDEMRETYQKKLDAKFVLTCQKCGSHSVERRSSVEQVPETQVLNNAGEQVDPADYRVG